MCLLSFALPSLALTSQSFWENRKLQFLLNRFIIFLIPLEKSGQLQEIGKSQRNKPKVYPMYVYTSSYLFNYSSKKKRNTKVLLVYADLKSCQTETFFLSFLIEISL